jgi:monofunctional biosynthetic peptidoglycan transglycosylase
VLKRILLALGVTLMAAAIVFYATLPDVKPLATSWPRTTAFMERRKAELARAGEPTRLEWVPVSLSQISPYLRQAVVLAEDARFYEHDGVDWEAVRGALEKDWEKRRLSVGASTITQQLAKNLYLSSARTPWRKLKEWAITRRLERLLPKERILELYLNVVELGRRTYGVEAAARRYFGKSAVSLTPREAAMLAAMLPSPRIYDPVRHASRVERRARRILRWMRAVESPTPIRSRLPEETPSAFFPSPPLPSN